jgi:hypothetical protein
LEGAPQSVDGSFKCHYNKLKSLEGAPQSVRENFFCHDNELISLEGAPQLVGGDFICNENELISLEGAPQSVGGHFWCDDFYLNEGQWDLQFWTQILTDDEYNESAKDLIATLPQFYEQADSETRALIKLQSMKDMM